MKTSRDQRGFIGYAVAVCVIAFAFFAAVSGGAGAKGLTAVGENGVLAGDGKRFTSFQTPGGIPVVLDARTQSVEVWPSVSVLSDPSHTMTLEQVLERRGDFVAPGGPQANLGPRQETVWLRVPVSRRIGEEGKGFTYLLDGLNPERMLIAAEALGIGRVALDRAVKYANERVVFDRPIGMNQGIQFPLADSLARLDAAELILRKATWLYDNRRSCGREANMAKYLCADAGFAAADRALQTHGGMGYSEEYHISRFFRESRLMKIAPVSQEMILNFLGEHVLGLPRSY